MHDKLARPARQHPQADVDVAIPCYRRATYIADAIESVLRQTIGRWHVTICDNGGSSEIAAAVQPYLTDPRVSYIPSGTELSLAHNWTRALSSGHCPYVAILNDDDRWHPNFLRRRVEALEAHPQCGLAFGSWVYVDESGYEGRSAALRFEEGVVSRETLAEEFTRHNVVVPSALVVRRSALEAVGAEFDGRWHYCDWEMWARLSSRFPAYYVAERDSDFRRHAATNTFATREDPERLIAMMEHIESTFEQHVDGFRRSGANRARSRALVLLHAAGDVHRAGGWQASGALYRRALRTYPLSFFDHTSLSMVARTVLGARLTGTLARATRSGARRLAGLRGQPSE